MTRKQIAFFVLMTILGGISSTAQTEHVWKKIHWGEYDKVILYFGEGEEDVPVGGEALQNKDFSEKKINAKLKSLNASGYIILYKSQEIKLYAKNVKMFFNITDVDEEEINRYLK